MMSGTLYGVGVGPGDPELITLKAVRILEKADFLAIPRTSAEKDSLALSIVNGVLRSKKEIIELVFPMSFDKKLLQNSWEKAVEGVKQKLDEGLDVAFITLGDPTVYSTYMYIHKTLKDMGYATEIIPGITSFCASAARAGISLGENSDTIAILPSAYECENLDNVLDSFDNIVLMKVSKNMDKLKEKLKEKNLLEKTLLVSKCGFHDERIEYDIEKIDEKLSYFTTMIIKNDGVR